MRAGLKCLILALQKIVPGLANWSADHLGRIGCLKAVALRLNRTTKRLGCLLAPDAEPDWLSDARWQDHKRYRSHAQITARQG